MWQEKAIVFSCEGELLSGVLHMAAKSNGRSMLMLAGGPQYRVGHARKSVMFAREMAASGTSVLRFDHRGTGDSSGPYLTFQQVEKDLAAALDELTHHVLETRQICVFGLGDAASSALMFSSYDARVTELILLNPRVKSDVEEINHTEESYFGKRPFSAAYWQNLLFGMDRVSSYVSEIVSKVTFSRKPAAAGSSNSARVSKDFRVRMRLGAEQFNGRVLLLQSGQDTEFQDFVAASRRWTQCVDGWTHQSVSDLGPGSADAGWKNQLVKCSREWMEQGPV
ncbi:MAG: hydrolase 1, exosortase A system-associated [Gammaproteobacteria bacterium]